MYTFRVVAALVAFLTVSANAYTYGVVCSDSGSRIPDASEAKSKAQQACDTHLRGTYRPHQYWRWCYTDSHGGYYFFNALNKNNANHDLSLNECVTWTSGVINACSLGGYADAGTNTDGWDITFVYIPSG